MNSGKWQINKVGLVDFWYYDEEAFVFDWFWQKDRAGNFLD